MKLKEYIRLIRPKHYIKNILLFLPIIFGGSLLQKDRLLHVIGGFVVFSFVSSVVYIINDICDAEKDRHHPTKCTRPIASGKIQKKSAAVLACFLLVASVAINRFVCEKNLYGWLLIALYLVLNLGYSFGLKNVVLLDILILVSGYLIRILYGSVITEIPVSSWLYLTVMAFSFYMGLGKRRGEIVNSE